MASKFLLTKRLESVPFDQPTPANTSSVYVLTAQEFVDLGLISKEMKSALETLVSAKTTYLDSFPTCFVGSFAVPSKVHPLAEEECFAFYFDKTHLIFLDESNFCKPILDAISKQGLLKEPTTPWCLFEFMKLLTKGDLQYLSDLEDKMEDVEESIIKRGFKNANEVMLNFRRKLLRLDTYYQQLMDMAGELAENENKLLTHQETITFVQLERNFDRLLQRAVTLKEYSLQLRELYQTEIDTQQNDTMKFFTVITTLFAPLTLVTGWFGMNFADMPGLSSAWGYPLMCCVVLLIVIVELIVFKHKGWL